MKLNINFHVISDKTKKSKYIKKNILKKIKNYKLSRAKCIIVIGGDGFMLKNLIKYYKYKKPFYGLNSGSYGFLMNKYSKKNFLRNLTKSKPVNINPIEMKVINKNNQIKKSIAVNEISILRQTKQAAKLLILNGKKIVSKKLIADGVLISTPAGSTAYNLSVHGPILDLNSKKIAITPISPFRPRRWRGIIISEKSNIKVINLDSNKRPISAVADNFEVRNAKNVKININKKIKFTLLYNKNNSLQKKIKIEQLRKETT